MKEKKEVEDPEVKDDAGLSIAYDRVEVKKFYPHLYSEISNKKSSMQIDAVETTKENKGDNSDELDETHEDEIPDELINPGPKDFLRRCQTNEEAIEILNYLLKREELTQEDYDNFLKEIKKEGGLEKLIKECGGFKRPGYYERKYYKKR